MATDNNRTKTPNDAVKITELPEGSQLLLVDKSGTVLERMEAERFMELLRATVHVGGRNLLRNTNKGSTNWQINTEYPKVCEKYVWPDGTRGAHLKISDTSASVAGTYKILMYKMETAVLKRLEPNSVYMLSLEVEALTELRFSARICLGTTKYPLTGTTVSQSMTRGERRRLYFELHTNNFTQEDISDQLIYLNCADFCELRVRDIKLERGNIASDWTPAPEDLGFGGGVIYWLIDCCKSAPSPLSQQTQTTTNQTKER